MTNEDMRVLGLIGGTSWHSTARYYECIHAAVNAHFGDNTNPPLLLFSINQAEMHRRRAKGDWDGVAEIFGEAASRLRAGGAEALMFCANTPHRWFDEVQASAGLPMIHIADATARAIRDAGLSRVGFIGTKYSMAESFLTDRMRAGGIETVVPEAEDVQLELQRIIDEELIFARTEERSKQRVLNVRDDLRVRGAEGIVLGCTEFPLLIAPSDLPIPVFDTTEIHARAAVEFILGLER